ncbi:MAG: hemerythrin domain-containing protein [Anaerolineae bacterium]|nr:hemerythrin domain-containing protein [Anaerolineae bacterium]
MSQPSKPNVAASLFTIHQVITRALDVSIREAKTLAREHRPHASQQYGFLNYLTALISVLGVHHLTENELAFPYFADKLPELPMAVLTRQHREIFSVLGELRVLVAEISSGALGELGWPIVGSTLVATRNLWRPHIEIEERHFDVEKIGEMLPAPEHLRLIAEFGEHSQRHSGPPFLTAPFILYNLPPEIRAIMAKGMPAEVVEHLIPVVWKERWASMRPYLLE